VETLEHQIGVITGASSGIGKSIALELAKQKVSLCLIGRNPDALSAVAEQARRHSPKVTCYKADFEQERDIPSLVSGLARDIDGIDILVHSAGTISIGAFEQARVEDLDRQYQVNVRAPYVLTQGLLGLLRARRGQVVFINSSVYQNARARVSQYAATKYALRALADSLRAEVNADGIRVLSIYPGQTNTPMQAALYQADGKEYRPENLMQPDDVAAAVVSALVLPRTAEITDINIRPMLKSS
jgi:short-subunit dehydrogenase